MLYPNNIRVSSLGSVVAGLLWIAHRDFQGSIGICQLIEACRLAVGDFVDREGGLCHWRYVPGMCCPSS